MQNIFQTVDKQKYLDFFKALTKKFGEDVVSVAESSNVQDGGNTTISTIYMTDVHGVPYRVGQWVIQRLKTLEGKRVKTSKTESFLIDGEALDWTKYDYSKVIQEKWCGKWEDVDHHPTDSTFFPKDFKGFQENLKAYKENSTAEDLRVIKRRERRF